MFLKYSVSCHLQINCFVYLKILAMQEAALPSAPHHCILSGRDGQLSPWLPICCHGASGSRRDLHAALSSSRAHRGAEVPGGLAVTPNGPHVSLSYLPFSASLWVLGLLLSQPASTVVLIMPSSSCLFICVARSGQP